MRAVLTALGAIRNSVPRAATGSQARRASPWALLTLSLRDDNRRKGSRVQEVFQPFRPVVAKYRRGAPLRTARIRVPRDGVGQAGQVIAQCDPICGELRSKYNYYLPLFFPNRKCSNDGSDTIG